MGTKPIVKLIRFFMILFAVFIALSFALISCGGGGGGGASTGTVTTSITDPPTCQSPNGPFDEVWVTITRVRAHTSSDAGSNDGGWVDLVDLRDNPRQINLFDIHSTDCLLTTLGSESGIPVGKYQQIRLYLLSNSPTGSEAVPSNNQCGDNGFNCVVMGGDTHTLLLSSQSNTGIKIPPGQIAGGGLTVVAGQTVDLNIDFDACSSIVRLGDGQYRLKPTLRAAEVSVNTNPISIRGRVIDNGTKDPIPNAIVALETRDAGGTSRIYAQKLTGQDGVFIFCPLQQGVTLFDVVAVAPNYNATITLQVPIGQMGDIPLMQETGGTSTAAISGQVTTVKSGPAPTPANVHISALQFITAESLWVTIPLLPGSISNVVTAGLTQSGAACLEGPNCADYSLNVPASNPYVGVFSTSPITYAKLPEADVSYRDEAKAFTSSTDGSIPNCSPDTIYYPVTVPSATPVNFSFTGCL